MVSSFNFVLLFSRMSFIWCEKFVFCCWLIFQFIDFYVSLNLGRRMVLAFSAAVTITPFEYSHCKVHLSLSLTQTHIHTLVHFRKKLLFFLHSKVLLTKNNRMTMRRWLAFKRYFGIRENAILRLIVFTQKVN